MSHKQVIVLRKDLNMRKGKMVAQGAHASMAAILNLGRREGAALVVPMDARIEPWLTGKFKKICVSVDSESQLLALYERAKADGVVCALIQDSGLTEFGGVPTYTAVAIGPDLEGVVDRYTSELKLL
jgi:PTH2 family peptidyl-tRNA hydrolase